MHRLTVTYLTDKPAPRGWRYLWAKAVTGFDERQHCARCLEGSYLTAFGLRMAVREPVALEVPDGGLLYLCGVSAPYVHANNLHAAFLPDPEAAPVEVQTYTRDRIVVHGGRLLPIYDDAARVLFGHKGPDFVTCRNFQFGAQYLG